MQSCSSSRVWWRHAYDCLFDHLTKFMKAAKKNAAPPGIYGNFLANDRGHSPTATQLRRIIRYVRRYVVFRHTFENLPFEEIFSIAQSSAEVTTYRKDRVRSKASFNCSSITMRQRQHETQAQPGSRSVCSCHHTGSQVLRPSVLGSRPLSCDAWSSRYVSHSSIFMPSPLMHEAAAHVVCSLLRNPLYRYTRSRVLPRRAHFLSLRAFDFHMSLA